MIRAKEILFPRNERIREETPGGTVSRNRADLSEQESSANNSEIMIWLT